MTQAEIEKVFDVAPSVLKEWKKGRKRILALYLISLSYEEGLVIKEEFENVENITRGGKRILKKEGL